MLQAMKNQTILVSMLVAGLSAAAWASPVLAQDERPLFYPPLPDAPRIQYLTSYTVPSDVYASCRVGIVDTYKDRILRVQVITGTP